MPKHRQQWRNTLESYAKPELGKMLVQDIGVQDVLRALQPIWMEKTETASRVRGRIEAVLSWATVAGHRTGDNPARWAGNLKELLPAPSKISPEENQPAIQIEDAPRWFAALQTREGFGARALEFLALTALRSKEVRGAQWDEIDLENALWVIPAIRMKMKREHRVPLPIEAVALLQALPRLADNPLVFPAARGGQLSDMTLSAAMKRMHRLAVDALRGLTNGADAIALLVLLVDQHGHSPGKRFPLDFAAIRAAGLLNLSIPRLRAARRTLEDTGLLRLVGKHRAGSRRQTYVLTRMHPDLVSTDNLVIPRA
jgi:integrase